MRQTVKCLLMVPNAESSLNEEAGKLLLEHYDDYFARARTMTRIHAMSEAKDAKPEVKTLSEIAPNHPAAVRPFAAPVPHRLRVPASPSRRQVHSRLRRAKPRAPV